MRKNKKLLKLKDILSRFIRYKILVECIKMNKKWIYFFLREEINKWFIILGI